MMTFRVMLLQVVLGLGLAGCSGPVALYHEAEGGAIAAARQPPPGADQPYPNLASVPPAPTTPAAGGLSSAAPAAPGVSPPSPGALAGLALPVAAPPPPDIPGLSIPTAPQQAVHVLEPTAQTKPTPPASVPVALAFAPGSALLPPETAQALAALAAAQGSANILVGGFGEAATPPGDAAALALGLARAARLADALTADGVPAGSITLQAGAAGSGGFVQLVY